MMAGMRVTIDMLQVFRCPFFSFIPHDADTGQQTIAFLQPGDGPCHAPFITGCHTRQDPGKHSQT